MQISAEFTRKSGYIVVGNNYTVQVQYVAPVQTGEFVGNGGDRAGLHTCWSSLL
jgi:hypothetical protein